MIYCSNCGKELKEGTKFCTSCGQPPTGDVSEQSHVTNSNGSAAQRAAALNLGSLNIDKEKISAMSKGYFTYLKETLFHPTTSFTKEASSNGLIQFVLLALLEMLIVWLASSSMSSYNVFGFKEALILLFFLLIFHFASVGVVYLVQKLILKNQDSFTKVATQYGGFFSGVVVLHALIFVVTLFSTSGSVEFLTLLIYLALFLSMLAFTAYLLGSPNTSKIDSTYIVAIGYFVLLITWFILFRISSAVVVNTFKQMMYRYMY